MSHALPFSLPVSSTIAVVGLGKIGLPLAVQYAARGYRVLGCDINPLVVAMVNAGQAHVQGEPGLTEGLGAAVASGLLSATLDTTGGVQQADVVVVIVPVAVDEQHRVDFATLDAATASVGAGLRRGTLVVYETTVPVGTTAGRVARTLERLSGLRAGEDFYLAYSPERVSSGSIFRDLRIYPKVIGGIDEDSTAAADTFYRAVLAASIITMASTDEAEFVKLIETTYRDVNIALANEYACYADARGLNIFTAIDAANSQPYSHIHTPGVGVGGHCIPVYPYFLLADTEEAAASNGCADQPSLTLPRDARRINDAMASYAVQRIESRIGALAGRAVLILGVAYRGDVRETAFTSTALLHRALVERGATVYIDDPLFSDDELRAMGYAPLCPEVEREICAILLQANHRAYQALPTELCSGRFVGCQVVLDGRNALKRADIELQGIQYIVIGDGRSRGAVREEADLVYNGGLIP